jgi:hypothetical protein
LPLLSTKGSRDRSLDGILLADELYPRGNPLG